MTPPLTVTIVDQFFINGVNGVNNMLKLQISKHDLGQKVCQLSMDSDCGYLGMIEGSLQYAEPPGPEKTTITVISDLQKSNTSINLVANGDVLPDPVVIHLGLLFPRAMDIMSGFSGFTISEELQQKQGQLKIENVTDSFTVVKKMTLPIENGVDIALDKNTDTIVPAIASPSETENVENDIASPNTMEVMEVTSETSMKLNILTVNDHAVPVEVSRDSTLVELKQTIETVFREKKLHVIPSGQQRLIFQGQILSNETIKLTDIPNLTDGQAIHLVTRSPNERRHSDSRVNRSTPYERPENNREDDLMDRAQASRAHTRLNNCRVLQRNFNACVDAAQINLDPTERVRHNDPETDTSTTPHVRDLGRFTQEMSNSMLTWSMQLHRLADQLIKDEPLPDRNAEQYQKNRRLIQNNMDASRYLSPQLQNFCQFVVPLGETPPRRLAVVNRTTQPRQINDATS